jgi:hypothetical protein
MTCSKKTAGTDSSNQDVEEFLLDLQRCFYSSLFIGANLCRRTTALESLRILDSHYPRRQQDSRDGDGLLRLLDDCYEKNKEIALALLQRSFSAATLGYDSSTKAADAWERCLTLCDSTNPQHSASAAYRILFVAGTPGFKTHVGPTEDVTLYLLESLMQRLMGRMNHFRRLDEDHRPVFGLLHCVRKIVSAMPSSRPWTADFGRLRAWATDLLATSTLVHKVICEILNRDAPEGATFDDILSDGGGSSGQVVLVSAWRTCKELSLLLAELVTISSSSTSLLSRQQVQSVVDYFVDVLSTAVHRGAFEQAFVGFTNVCVKLWRSHLVEDRAVVETLLATTLAAVEERDFCPTRRSAGIPLLLQALLVGEASSLMDKGPPPHLAEAVKTLLRASASTMECVRVQAYNILRALYRNTALGENINAFVEKGVCAAILGFKSPSWAVSIASFDRSSSMYLSDVAGTELGQSPVQRPGDARVRSEEGSKRVLAQECHHREGVLQPLS